MCCPNISEIPKVNAIHPLSFHSFHSFLIYNCRKINIFNIFSPFLFSVKDFSYSTTPIVIDDDGKNVQSNKISSGPAVFKFIIIDPSQEWNMEISSVYKCVKWKDNTDARQNATFFGNYQH